MLFRYPWILALLPLAIGFVVWQARRQHRRRGMTFPSGLLLADLPQTFKLRSARRLVWLRTLVYALALLALARPQGPAQQGTIHREGIDIVLVLDASTSMLAEDFQLKGLRVNRSDVVKDVVRDFVKERPDDRIGLVAFAGIAYTLCPLTLDHGWLLTHLERVTPGMFQDGTAIGTALSVALNRLKDSRAKSKIIILLTDGINNAGEITPMTAAEAARALGVKIYTIGAGSRGPVPYPFQDIYGRVVYRQVLLEIDEASLKDIARVTLGEYFRATDTASLRRIYEAINKMEKVRFEEKGFEERQELFPLFLLPALVLIVLETVLKNTWLRVTP
ncbi:MAG: vWA domain-containing protein [Deltaproteobacteria bacterium]